MTIDRSETLRYLRMGGAAPGAGLAARIDLVEREVCAACRPAACWRLEPVVRGAGPGELEVGAFSVRSLDLARVLSGCRHAFLFCATIGADVDALLRRLCSAGAADALIAQAAATAAIEAWCDECEGRMRMECGGEALRMRYSPGYGDLPLEAQRPLLRILDAARRAGIHLTDACQMAPTKSVSAVIGAAPENVCEDRQ